VRAGGDLIQLLQRYGIATGVTAEATGAGECAGGDGVGLSSGDSADDNEGFKSCPRVKTWDSRNLRGRWRYRAGAEESRRMAREMSSLLMRNTLDSIRTDEPCCSRCRRNPLVGEFLHLLESGKRVCSLCLPQVVTREGEPVSAELVRSNERRLAVVQQRRAA